MKNISKSEFPRRLREIPDAPDKLFVEGMLPPEDSKWLCVVGSRKYSSYGKNAVEKLIAGLMGYPVVIVSGLALGIDAIAHETALSAGLLCVGVPGSGLNREVLYPASNRNLADRILKAGGALVSEFEPDFRATQWSFPQRNRIMAGLSDAVLVIEAEAKSGTLITSRLATDYNRDVFTVPGSIFSEGSAGPHMLIRMGATPITSEGDLLSALGFDVASTGAKDYSNSTAEEKVIIEILASPKTREELIELAGMPIGQINSLISIMELKGYILESGGQLMLK